jgi:solute carrier family 35 (GDP-fucose transporter), member C1
MRDQVPALSFFPRFEYDLTMARKVAPLTFCFLGMIICNNLCLKFVEVSFYQVARSWTIICNIVIGYLYFHTSTSRKSIMCCVVIVIGYIISVDGEVNFSLTGVIFGLASSVFVSLYSIQVKRVLPAVDGNTWRLMIYNNMNALLVMPVVIVLSGELTSLQESFVVQTNYFWVVTAVTGSFGFLINIASFMQISHTGALTHNVSGTAKACVQTVLGVMIWQNPISFKAGIGTFITIAGCALYSFIRITESSKNKTDAPAPSTSTSKQPPADIELGRAPVDRSDSEA